MPTFVFEFVFYFVALVVHTPKSSDSFQRQAGHIFLQREGQITTSGLSPPTRHE